MVQERRRRREEGQAVTAVAIVVVLVLVAAALGIVFRTGKVSSEVSKIQSGADAAALAGAQQVREDAYDNIVRSLQSRVPRGFWSCGDGQGRAQSFASRNSTDVTTYCYYPLADRVEVSVRSDFVTETGRRESADAVAQTGRRLGPCIVVAVPGSTTGYETTADCGDVTVRVYVDTTGNVTLLTTVAEVKKMFRVTLRE
ncbi:pilus assembly protein TadG-related protein [Phycicoccus jejuensis]|uniref:pilus assembly protein TadG-related protein n=1 Tax=Phycicoccus TaxID=367298 RepID=UPI0004C4303C|nr:MULTISPECIES: pilus assembly protein TadG-related protein [Phycicoccus]GIL35665.1 hypothetical protein PDTK01_17400 [Phycicoccus sp. DTK01]